MPQSILLDVLSAQWVLIRFSLNFEPNRKVFASHGAEKASVCARQRLEICLYGKKHEILDDPGKKILYKKVAFDI